MSDLVYHSSGNFLYVSGVLQDAFDNDFPTIFASGTAINVLYDLEIKSSNRIVAKNRFRHTVSYNPVSGVYELRKDGDPEAYRSNSVEEVIQKLSYFSFGIPFQHSWEQVQIKVEARLPVVHFEQMDKEVDLMVLWKYKKPASSIRADLRTPY